MHGFILRARADRCRAFTLIELLVVLAIIALLIALLLTYLRASREEAKAIKCLANLRTVGSATIMYFEDSDGAPLVPWYQIPPHAKYAPSVVTPWVFGGFRAPNPDPADLGVDSSQYPAQIRPLNKYIDATAQASAFNFDDRNHDIIREFICPGDRSNSTAIIGDPGEWVEEEMRSSWQANGSSYTLNTRWLQGYVGQDFSAAIHDPVQNAELSTRLARHFVGGTASRFVMWSEQGFYSATYNAAPYSGFKDLPPALPQRQGWHRKFSSWSMAFADGHAAHGFFDTRQIYGLGGTIWQPNFPEFGSTE